MAFGFAGAAQGASRALEEIVAQRLLEQKLEAEIADRRSRQEMERQQLSQRQKEFDVETGQRQQTIEMQAGDRRARSNQQGVRRMLGEAITQGDGPMTSQDRRGLAALQVEAGDAPTMLEEPKPERDPIADYRERKKIDKEYAEPPRPERGPGPFVVGGNLVDARGNVIFRGQDASAAGPSPYATERNARTSAAVEDILSSVSRWNTGFGGLLANVPETDARELRGKLNTLKANIAFNELTAMREASKTGGALGSVAVRELELLENALGNLDQMQDPQSLTTELMKIKQSAERWQQAAGTRADAMQPVTSHGATPGATPPAAAPKRLRFDRTGKPIP